MKGAIGESVDGENVAVLTGEPVLKERQVVTFQQLAGGEGGETQSDGVGLVILHHLVAHLEGVFLQDAEGLRPGLCRMDVGAVGEMMLVVEMHGVD